MKSFWGRTPRQCIANAPDQSTPRVSPLIILLRRAIMDPMELFEPSLVECQWGPSLPYSPYVHMTRLSSGSPEA